MQPLIMLNNLDITSYLKGYKVDISDLDTETSRNAAGLLFRTRVAVKRKISLEFQPLTQVEIQRVLNAVKDVFFEVYFLDPELGYTKKKMYVGDRSNPFYYFSKKDTALWQGLSFNLIEQ